MFHFIVYQGFIWSTYGYKNVEGFRKQMTNVKFIATPHEHWIDLNGPHKKENALSTLHKIKGLQNIEHEALYLKLEYVSSLTLVHIFLNFLEGLQKQFY